MQDMGATVLAVALLATAVAVTEPVTCQVSSAPHASSLLAIAKTYQGPSPSLHPETQLRPSEGGAPDVIQFSVLPKSFMGLDFAAQTWKADVVISLSWHDNRATRLIPAGHSEITVSEESAANGLWTPDVVVTNIDLEGSEAVISTNFRVNNRGIVNKTQRIICRLVADFRLQSFPYDTQDLYVKLASRTYMSDDLKMEAMSTADTSAEVSDLFSDVNWVLNSAKQLTVEEEDGALRKSRGELMLSITHDPSGIYSSSVLPAVLLVILSYTVFLMPMDKAFVMPRVATGMIAFLSLLTLSQQSLDNLPPINGICWLELFDVLCRFLVFITVVLNIFVEVICYQWYLPEMGHRVSREIMMLYPVVTVFTLGIVFMAKESWYLLVAKFLRIFLICGSLLFVSVWSRIAALQMKENSMEEKFE
eukprot:CAMPEP_0197653318 /NCGR_PEP_ID=MMETSP1338-20131121/35013_1 /TAXON_ID=43686 ORGANISM="Pelagodinium beii, Strain RCC1491" /NCGR_SAMPLE_ID=MMETSP1338 /ASSEMBLY_ACC=CAM_ASM_000754 /LENGTH=419 /DNA_ID=CAMNT_0043228375 /DNA_START=54 /DNA_END=1311 /DNA_ORIENTATION=+